MKGNIVELKLWRSEWGTQAHAWFESRQYPAFWRTIPNDVYRESFAVLPQLMGSLVFGVFGEGLIDPQTKEPILAGLVTIYEFDPNARVAATGVMIDKRFHGGGLASDAFLTLFRYLYDAKNLRKITIEFSASDEKILRIVNRFGKLVDPNLKDGAPIESNPFFEGRRKKQAFLEGKYHDYIMVGVFKNQFEKILEKFSEARNG